MTKHRPARVPAPQWWMHLRKYWKRVFWKRDRKAGKDEVRRERDVHA